MTTNILFKELAYKVTGMAFRIHSKLGSGLLESIYEKAFCIELNYSGIPFTCQHAFPLYYRNELIGNYIADIVIDNSIIVELKSVKELNKIMVAAPAHPCARGICPSLDFSSDY